MDFLIAHGFEQAADAESLQAHRYSELDQLVCNQTIHGVQHLVWGDICSVVADHDRTFCFDGGTSIAHQYFHSHLGQAAPVPLAKALADRELPPAGIYCVIAIQRGDQANTRLATDWLGQYPVYIWHQGRNFAVSNNILMLEKVTGAARSILPAVENMVTGGVSDRHVHLQDTWQLPYGHELSIQNGELELKRRTEPGLSELSYQDCIQSLRQSIAEHIAAALAMNADVEPYIICDLTGGCDSRAVLAMLMDQAKGRPIHVRTMGRYPNPDVIVAAYLQQEYRLKNGRFPSIAAPRDLAVRFNAVLSGGAREAGAVLSPMGFRNLIHFKGCYGEIGGATPGHDFIAEAFIAGDGLQKAIDILFARRRRAGAINFTTPEALNFVRATLIDEYQQLLDAGHSPATLFSERYLRARSRTHFGLLSFMENKSKVLPDILANRWLIEAARRLHPAQRSQNKVIFDLIRGSSHVELAFMPMANKKWSTNIVNALDRGRLERMEIITSKSNYMVGEGGPMYSTVSVAAGLADSYQSLIPVPLAGAAVTPQLANLASHKATGGFFADELDKHAEAWFYFDREKLLDEIRRADQEFRSDGIDANALGIFSSAAAWLLRLDHAVSLRQSIEFPAQ